MLRASDLWVYLVFFFTWVKAKMDSQMMAFCCEWFTGLTFNLTLNVQCEIYPAWLNDIYTHIKVEHMKKKMKFWYLSLHLILTCSLCRLSRPVCWCAIWLGWRLNTNRFQSTCQDYNQSVKTEKKKLCHQDDLSSVAWKNNESRESLDSLSDIRGCVFALSGILDFNEK